MAQVLVSESNLSDIADAIRAKNGSSDTYKPGEMAAAISALPTGGEEMTRETVTGSTPTITPEDKTWYQCGTLSSLTVSTPPSTGNYVIVFTSGSTATTTTIPSTILGLEDFSADASTIYEINVMDNRAVVGSWAVS